MNNYADRELCQEIYDRGLIKYPIAWFDKENTCPAYNCTELLDALPILDSFPRIMKRNKRSYDVYYHSDELIERADTPCNALAKMLLYLDDKKLLKKGVK